MLRLFTASLSHVRSHHPKLSWLAIAAILGVISLFLPFPSEDFVPKRSGCVPTFQDGDGPYYLPNQPLRHDLRSPEFSGITLKVSGRLLAADCQTPIADVLIDIWQANDAGIYVNEWFRGRVRTAHDGSYTFTTGVPKGYGEGTAYRPPHIHFKIWKDRKLLITSEMFFPDVVGKPGFREDFIMGLTKKRTLRGTETWYGRHDIIVP